MSWDDSSFGVSKSTALPEGFKLQNSAPYTEDEEKQKREKVREREKNVSLLPNAPEVISTHHGTISLNINISVWFT